jgi:hypothetical protein
MFFVSSHRHPPYGPGGNLDFSKLWELSGNIPEPYLRVRVIYVCVGGWHLRDCHGFDVAMAISEVDPERYGMVLVAEFARLRLNDFHVGEIAKRRHGLRREDRGKGPIIALRKTNREPCPLQLGTVTTYLAPSALRTRVCTMTGHCGLPHGADAPCEQSGQ